MATIGSISLLMSAGTGKFTRDLATADAASRRFAGTLGSVQSVAARVKMPSAIMGGMGKLLAGLGVAGAGVGMAAFTKRSLEAVDAQDEMAGRIGTTAGELGKLHYVAKLTGTETDALDNSLSKMVANLGDAAAGSGPAAKTLAALGLDARQLATLDPGAAFEKIAFAIGKIDAPAQRAAAAMDIFGRGGLAIMNTLNAGPEKFAALSKEAERLGLVLSEDAVSKVSQANDAMDRMSFALSGLGNTLAVATAPAVTYLSEKVVSLFEQFQTGEGIIGRATVVLRSWADTAMLAARGVGIGFQVFFTLVSGTFDNLTRVIGTLPTNLGIVGLWVARNWTRLINDGLNASIIAFSNFGKNIGKLAESVWEWLQNPMGGFKAPDFTPILDGFKATVDELPKLVTPALRDVQGEIGKILWSNVGEEIGRQLTPGTNAGGKRAGPFNLSDAAASGSGSARKLAGLAEMNSKEAYSAVANLRAGGSKAVDQTAKNTATANQHLAKIADQTAKLASTGGAALPVFAF